MHHLIDILIQPRPAAAALFIFSSLSSKTMNQQGHAAETMQVLFQGR